MLALTTAALLGGMAGYALLGPLADQPSQPAEVAPPKSLVPQRNAFIGAFNPSNHWMIIADSYAGRGKTAEAAGLLQSAVRSHPRDYALWLALGNALTDHARTLTPAARLAFKRSAALAPTSRAPAYFLGKAMLRSGDTEGALRMWRELLAAAPAEASWRPIVEDDVANANAR